ncbi:MAG: hypothetical protein QF415_08720 [Candidatus Undinarchaeales archaeon]|nr:hypothetical protein [Candidatus Undinarchaeales archaeon]MDP7494145.1 hypothetical protein [Candidatus Undinarchaeales archaeon]
MERKCSVCKRFPSKEVLVFNEDGSTNLLLVCGRCVKGVEGGKLPSVGMKADRSLGIVNGRFAIEDVDSILHYFREDIYETPKFVIDLDIVFGRVSIGDDEPEDKAEAETPKIQEFRLPGA